MARAKRRAKENVPADTPEFIKELLKDEQFLAELDRGMREYKAGGGKTLEEIEEIRRQKGLDAAN